MTDMEPPEDLYIEIRVLEDCGELATANGNINLHKNSVLMVRRCDVEHLLKQKLIIQTK